MDTEDRLFIEAVDNANSTEEIDRQRKSLAALTIQSHIRGYFTRKDGYSMKRKEEFSAVADLSRALHADSTSTIARMLTNAPPPSCASSSFAQKRNSFCKVKSRELLTPKKAILVIQRAWRRHIDQQVFRYYRDLINFKDKGNPSKLLRCINPAESRLLDSASGVHVRFRLAGLQFPPSVYYKLFTRRPVQDMCANSPKDYTQNALKRTSAYNANNKSLQELPKIDKSRWYQREENNGWRLVSDRLPQVGKFRLDPTYISDQYCPLKRPFLHSKLLRKEDVDKRRKKKKIEWLKKMYLSGGIRAKSEDHDTIELINGATIGMLNTIDKEGEEAVQNWEVDELLNWTSTLNYDDYLIDWQLLATSQNTMHNPEIDEVEMRPLELNSFTPNIRIGSSHNTPVSNGPSM